MVKQDLAWLIIVNHVYIIVNFVTTEFLLIGTYDKTPVELLRLAATLLLFLSDPKLPLRFSRERLGDGDLAERDGTSVRYAPEIE